MTNAGPSKSLRRLTASALLLCAGWAHAQYAWIDAKGQRHYSDLPPPPSTPAAKILKAPRQAALAVVEAPAPVAAATPPKGPPTLAEREADFKKRAADRDKRERDAGDEARRNADMAENCNVARRVKAQMESGVRMSTADASGASTVMSDVQRAQELARASKIVAGCR
jgi:hypothetical protein